MHTEQNQKINLFLSHLSFCGYFESDIHHLLNFPKNGVFDLNYSSNRLIYL